MLQRQLKRVLDSMPQSGNCPICSTESRNRCTRCKKIFYCTVDHQKQDWDNHKPACTPLASTIQQWSVNQLDEAAKKGTAPTAENVRRDYGFVNCKDADEELKLLRLYAGLIVLLKRDLIRLHGACITGKLKELITNEYEKYGEKRASYDWFKENPDVVKNQHPLPFPQRTASAEPVASTSSTATAASSTATAASSTAPTPSTTDVKAEPAAEVKAEPTEGEEVTEPMPGPGPEAVKSEPTQ